MTQRNINDVLMLRPAALPASGVDGELRVDSGDSNNLKIYKSGWVLPEGNAGNLSVETFTSVDTLDANNQVALLDGSSAFTLNLPTAVGVTGKSYHFKVIDDTNAITIDPNSTETIDGVTTIDLQRLHERMSIVSDGTNWKILTRDRIEHSEVRLHTAVASPNQYGSTATKIPRFVTTVVDTGTAITYTDSVANGATFDINEDGIYTVQAVWYASSNTAARVGIMLNGTEKTTSVINITNYAQRVSHDTCFIAAASGSHGSGAPSWTGKLVNGDEIVIQTDGPSTTNTTRCSISIIKVSG